MVYIFSFLIYSIIYGNAILKYNLIVVKIMIRKGVDVFMAKGFEIGECFIGYIYNSDGKHCGKIYLDKSPQNIATFIARGLSVSRIEITDIADR